MESKTIPKVEKFGKQKSLGVEIGRKLEIILVYFVIMIRNNEKML